MDSLMWGEGKFENIFRKVLFYVGKHPYPPSSPWDAVGQNFYAWLTKSSE